MPKKKTSRSEKVQRRQRRKSEVSRGRVRYLQKQFSVQRFPHIRYVNQNSPGYLESRVKEIIDDLIVGDKLPEDLRNDLALFAVGQLQQNHGIRNDPLIRLGQSLYEKLMTGFLSTVQWGDNVSIDPDHAKKGGILVTLQSMEKFKIRSTSATTQRRSARRDRRGYGPVPANYGILCLGTHL